MCLARMYGQKDIAVQIENKMKSIEAKAVSDYGDDLKSKLGVSNDPKGGFCAGV